MHLPINVVGSITNGEYSGWQVRIEKSSPSDSSFLILICKDFSIDHAEGYDDWVEDEDALTSYFLEAEYDVNWSS